MNQLDLATLKFPLQWHSRLIVMVDTEVDANAIHSVFQTLGLAATEVVKKGISSNGKYVSWHLSCHIPDIVIFRAITRALQDLPGFVMLL